MKDYQGNDTVAPSGQIWVCGACSKTNKDRYKFLDAACMLNAVLCYEQKVFNTSTLLWEWDAVEPQPPVVLTKVL